MAVNVHRRIFVAVKPFLRMLDGRLVRVDAGDTVREGHPLLEGAEEYFTPRKNEAKFEWDEPKKAAPAKSASATKDSGK